MKESEIKFKVSLDDENIPEKIEWDADEKEKLGYSETKSISVSLWDSEQKNTLRIDLWAKDMPLDDMTTPYLRTFERHASNSDGIVSVCIAYARLVGSEIEYYGSSSFKTSHNGQEYSSDVTPIRASFQSQVLNNDVAAQNQLTLVRDEIITALTDGFTGLHDSVYNVDTDLSGLESKIDGVESKVDDLHDSVNNVEAKVDNIPVTDLSGLESKIDLIPMTCPDVSIDLSSLESKIDNLNVTVPPVDLTSVHSKLDAIQAELPINLTGTTITVNLDDVNEKLDTLVSASSGSSSSYYSSSSSSSKFLLKKKNDD